MNDSEKLSLLDKSIMIAIYPALGYFLVYLYEVGYVTIFDIPIEFININMSNFVNIVPMIFPKLIKIFLIWFTISNLININDLENPITYKIYEIFTVCACFFILAFFSYNVQSMLLSMLEATIIIYAVTFLCPLITKPKVKGYRNKFIAQMNESNENHIQTLTYHHVSKIGYINIKTIIFFIFISITIFQAGIAEAMLKTDYYKVNDNVVIRIYNDVIICCEYDSKSKKIDDSSFKVLQKNNIDNLKFEEIILNSKASEIKK